MARPKKPIDENLVASLAEIHCTLEEIGAVVGCSRDTLERRFAAIIKDAKDRGKASLRRAQMKAALGGNVTMLIWMGKQLLEQRDKSPAEIEAEKQARSQPLTREDLAALVVAAREEKK